MRHSMLAWRWAPLLVLATGLTVAHAAEQLHGVYEEEGPAAALFGPVCWTLCSLAVWLLYVLARGWEGMGRWDRQQFLWGIFSIFAFANFLQRDPEFKGWGDVYFFCGRQLQYCSCNFRWNVYGWLKATVLWNFVLTSALGAQRLAIQVGLNGLLPGARGNAQAAIQQLALGLHAVHKAGRQRRNVAAQGTLSRELH